MNIKPYILAIGLTASLFQTSAMAQSPAELNDLEIAHVAYIADNIDIRYAHLALAISNNEEVRGFAENMINDHTAVNEQALALLKKLNAQPQDNFLSKSLLENAEVKALFETGLGIFKAHEGHAEMMVKELN